MTKIIPAGFNSTVRPAVSLFIFRSLIAFALLVPAEIAIALETPDPQAQPEKAMPVQPERQGEPVRPESVEQSDVVGPVEINILQIETGNGETLSVSTRTASWYLAKNLGLVVNLKVCGAEPELYQSASDKANLLAGALGFELPPMPELSGFGDAFVGHQYLCDVNAAESVRNFVLNRHGDDCACVFDLGANTMMSGLLYSSEVNDQDSGDTQLAINNMLVQNIKLAAMGSGFQTVEDGVGATIGFVQWMEELKPEGEEFGGVLSSTCSSIEQLLAQETTEPESAAETKPAELTDW